MSIAISYHINKSSRYDTSSELAIIGRISYSFLDEFGNQKRVFKFSTGEKCKIGKLKNGKVASAIADSTRINSKLADYTFEAKKLYYSFEEKKSFPQPEVFRDMLLGKTKKVEEERNFMSDFDTYISNQIDNGTSLTFQKSLNRLKFRLNEFSEKSRYSLDYTTINLTFYAKFRAYCRTVELKGGAKGLNDNTFGGYIKLLKCFMNYALAEGWHNSNFYKHKKFAIINEAKPIIALTENELLAIHELDLSKRKGLELTRDYFVLACETALRYSDYGKLRKLNIEEVENGYNLKVKTQKTKAHIIVPLSKVAISIFEKYSFNIPPPPTNQKMNKNLKVIAGFAEIDKLIGTHTGRRTFCTIQYNAKMPIQWIMKISSHKTEREFYKYIGVDEKENAELFRNAQSEKYAIDTKGLLKPKMRIA